MCKPTDPTDMDLQIKKTSLEHNQFRTAVHFANSYGFSVEGCVKSVIFCHSWSAFQAHHCAINICGIENNLTTWSKICFQFVIAGVMSMIFKCSWIWLNMNFSWRKIQTKKSEVVSVVHYSWLSKYWVMDRLLIVWVQDNIASKF